MSASRSESRSAARRAEPTGIGSAGARDPLAVEGRLLVALLGQVIEEQAGEGTFELVERLRRAAIALRRSDDPALRTRVEAELDGLDLGAIEAVISAFSLYFQLVNLAEARDVVDEVQLVELLRRPHEVRPLVAHGHPIGCHGHHLTRVRKVAVAKGCGRVLPRLRKRPGGSGA